jgi:nodulation protein E
VKRVVVTGLGAVSGCGIGVPALWDACRQGRSAVRDFRLPELKRQMVTNAAFISQADMETVWVNRKPRFQDPVAAIGLHAAAEAVAQAGLGPQHFGSRCGVVVGSGIGGAETIQRNALTFAHDPLARVDPFAVPKVMANASAAWIAMEYGATGPMLCISTACASASQSAGLGASLIRSGQIDRCIVGGSEAQLAATTFRAWEAMRVMTQGLCRPFSKGRDGMSLGDGAGILVLESEEAALARGAEILCEFVGFANNCDAIDLLRPNAARAAECMTAALADAGVDPSRVGYVNAHGTATVANDRSEGEALRTVFGAGLGSILVSSTKPVHGHALGASGALELIVSVQALREGIAPPTLNFLEPDPDIGIDPVSAGPTPFSGDVAISNSFAFGGVNATIVIARPGSH